MCEQGFLGEAIWCWLTSSTFKKSFSGSLKSVTSDTATELPDTPLAVLRVQIVSCRDLPSADLNGKSDP